jgi:filamentous hemagglutinin
MTGLSSPLAPGGGLAGHEARGGHTIARHVGKSVVELSERLATQSSLKAASSFSNRAAAESAVSSTLGANSSEISSWLSGSAQRLVLTHSMGDAIGWTLERGASFTQPASSVRMVLVRDAASSIGYRILTAYPEKR